MPKATLYVIPGSHPALTARLMLERKGIPYRRRDLIPVISRGALKALRFPRNTVPGLKIDGRKVSGTREIARVLDELQPEPPLFPADPELRARVEEAEAWGDPFQQVPRTILWWCLKRNRTPLRSFSVGARLGVPLGLAMRTAAPIVAMAGRLNSSDDETVRGYVEGIPESLDRIDRWIADGVLGGEEPNAADYQVATSVRLLMSLDDLRPMIELRPAGTLAMRVVPEYPGRIPPVLPAEWLASMRATAGASPS